MTEDTGRRTDCRTGAALSFPGIDPATKTALDAICRVRSFRAGQTIVARRSFG